MPIPLLLENPIYCGLMRYDTEQNTEEAEELNICLRKPFGPVDSYFATKNICNWINCTQNKLDKTGGEMMGYTSQEGDICLEMENLTLMGKECGKVWYGQ